MEVKDKDGPKLLEIHSIDLSFNFLYTFALSPNKPIVKMPNTVTYFDITIGGAPAGRLTFELFDDVVPKVCPFARVDGKATTDE